MSWTEEGPSREDRWLSLTFTAIRTKKEKVHLTQVCHVTVCWADLTWTEPVSWPQPPPQNLGEVTHQEREKESVSAPVSSQEPRTGRRRGGVETCWEERDIPPTVTESTVCVCGVESQSEAGPRFTIYGMTSRATDAGCKQETSAEWKHVEPPQ